MATTTGGKAFLLAGTQSGSGKTTLTLGLLAALRNKGLKVQPFKCGPDFIDPTLHRLATGVLSRNLDLWMMGEEFSRQTFARHSSGVEISLIEGVMGMFDGGDSSSARLAKALQVPVVLVLDVRSMAESAAAVVKGFESLDPAVAVGGVILNRVASERHFSLLRQAIADHCRAELLGFLPRSLDFEIPSRHLGLRMGAEAPLGAEALARLAQTVAENIDLDRLVALAGPAGGGAVKEEARRQVRARIGVARDAAFCFYYEENLELLESAGAELVFFSPGADRALPEGLDGLYLGGGYPELFCEELSDNRSMRESIRAFAASGRPIHAECGGFMYLCEEIVDLNGKSFPMAGVFPAKAAMQARRASLGYREVRLRKDGHFGPAGTVLRGHEFHYSAIGAMPKGIERLYAATGSGVEFTEGYRLGNTLGSYIHLHFGSAPEAARAFVNLCAKG
ncbi:cobyrinate a,c-diamide synthase [Thiovibrio sp. JS02]